MNFAKSYPPINFLFTQNPRDFIVEEIPMYQFSGCGEHRILKIRKKDLSTFEMIDKIAMALNISKKDIGYAGLKDKNALTYQFISIHKKHDISPLQTIENIKIIEENFHDNKIKIGHLRGNTFKIKLKKIAHFDFTRLSSEFLKTEITGFPNFFGMQRFGMLNDNYKYGEKIKNKPIKKQTKMDKFFISSLQSYYFNKWLSKRMEISNIFKSFSPKDIKEIAQKEFGLAFDINIVKLLKDIDILLMPLIGDICKHYPYGKLFFLQDFKSELKRLKDFDISITGALCGDTKGLRLASLGHKDLESEECLRLDCAKLDSKNTNNFLFSRGDALNIERYFLHSMQAFGSRRYALVRSSNLDIKYLKQEAQCLLSFSLPSGSYATTLLSYIKNDEIKED